MTLLRQRIRERVHHFREEHKDEIIEKVELRKSELRMGLDAAKTAGIEFDYRILPVTSFTVARAYRNFAPNWCITHEEDAWNDYRNWNDRIYFCLNDGMATLEPVKGDLYPYDAYGLSLIAVQVGKDHRIAGITSRWNEDESRDFFISPKMLKEILGRQFQELGAEID